MRTVEAFISGALILVGLYLLFNSPQVSAVLREFASGSARIITALQGRGS